MRLSDLPLAASLALYGGHLKAAFDLPVIPLPCDLDNTMIESPCSPVQRRFIAYPEFRQVDGVRLTETSLGGSGIKSWWVSVSDITNAQAAGDILLEEL